MTGSLFFSFLPLSTIIPLLRMNSPPESKERPLSPNEVVSGTLQCHGSLRTRTCFLLGDGVWVYALTEAIPLRIEAERSFLWSEASLFWKEDTLRPEVIRLSSQSRVCLLCLMVSVLSLCTICCLRYSSNLEAVISVWRALLFPPLFGFKRGEARTLLTLRYFWLASTSLQLQFLPSLVSVGGEDWSPLMLNSLWEFLTCVFSFFFSFPALQVGTQNGR